MPSLLRKLKIIKGYNTSSERTFNILLSHLGVASFEEIVYYNSPHLYVNMLWNEYKALGISNNSLNGSLFEVIIDTLLYREGILPYYIQANVAFVPNVNFDLVLYSKESPVSLSLKTSLRERYKQADLEAIALKYVHRKAKCYLLTLEVEEALNVNKKIADGQAIGLDKAILCSDETFDSFIQDLKSRVFTESQTVDVVTGRFVKRSE